MTKQLDISKVVGGGYNDFWSFKGRYRVLKGGRASKKSCTVSLYYIYNMMMYYHKYGVKPNLLVIRRFFNTHRQSTFEQLKWAIEQLGVAHLWKSTNTTLTLEYLPSGQKIIFRGMDDPQSITSITVANGSLCWVWWEEAFQIASEDDFNKVDMSIRGETPYPLFKQHTLTFNPWSENTWIKKRFFDVVDKNNELYNPAATNTIMAVTKNYDCNEFLDEADIELFEMMRRDFPRRYSIEGLGNWGIAEGLIFDNMEVLQFDEKYLMSRLDSSGNPLYKVRYGMDFGFTNDPTAVVCFIVDEKNSRVWVYDEIYERGMTNARIVEALREKHLHKCRIVCDSAEPRTINELSLLGVNRLVPSKKGNDSIRFGIQKIKDFKVYIHPRCVNFMMEATNYVWETDRMTGLPTDKPIDDFCHLMDAFRYGMEDINSETFSW